MILLNITEDWTIGRIVPGQSGQLKPFQLMKRFHASFQANRSFPTPMNMAIKIVAKRYTRLNPDNIGKASSKSLDTRAYFRHCPVKIYWRLNKKHFPGTTS